MAQRSFKRRSFLGLAGAAAALPFTSPAQGAEGISWKMVTSWPKNSPGPGITALKWLMAKKIVMTGGDTSSVEAVPGENPERPFEGHQLLLNHHGVHNLENLDLEELAADRVYEFAFVFSPLKLKGATGSPGNPIAVR